MERSDQVVEKILEINSLILGVFGLSTFSILKGIYELWKKSTKEKKERQQALDDRFNKLEKTMIDGFDQLKKTDLSILHNKIYKQAMEHIAIGYITPDAMDDLEHLYVPYRALGGNGTAESLYKSCHALPKIKPEETKK